MALDPFFLEFVTAAAVGALIGIEREHRADQTRSIAGIRTFPLVSLSGFMIAFLAQRLGDVGAGLVMAAGLVGAFGLAYMFIQLRQSLGFSGITTPVALLLTFILGMSIAFGYTFEAVVVAILATFLLVLKERLHRFASYLDEQELISSLQFATIAFILLPLTATLPASIGGFAWLGRGALVDPYVILLVVVVVSSISFVSLLAMRTVGTRQGLEMSGLLGGLVNSEATTASLAQRSREEPTLVHAVTVAAILASTTMLLRNLAIAAIADTSLRLFLGMAPLVLPAALLGGLLAWHLRGAKTETAPPVRVKSPFAILPALRFALVFAGLSLFTTFATRSLGDAGVYVTSLGGFVSAGAVVASMGSLVAQGSLALPLALRASLLAVAASVVGKLGILAFVDPPTFRRALGPFLGLAVLALAGAALSFVV